MRQRRASRPRPSGALATALVAAAVIGTASARSQALETAGRVWANPPVKATLENGLTIIHQQDEASAITALKIFIPGGRAAVPAGKDGLAHLVTRLALEIPDAGRARDIMAQGTRIWSAALEDATLISVECLSADFAAAVKTAAEIIRSPLFSGLRIEAVKSSMRIQGQAQDDDLSAAGHHAAMGALFGPGGLGGTPFGTEATLKEIRKEDITTYYATWFTKSGLVFAVVSDLERAAVEAVLAEAFDKLTAGGAPVPAIAAPPSEPTSREVVLTRASNQTYIALAWRLPPTASPRSCALAHILEGLVGKGPGSRLWGLRTERRLAYNVNAAITMSRRGSALEAYLESSLEKRTEAERSLREAMAALHEDGASAEEFEAARTFARARFLRDNETKSSRAFTLGLFESLGLGFDFLSGFPEAAAALTLDDLNAYIRESLDPALAVLVRVGPAAPQD